MYYIMFIRINDGIWQYFAMNQDQEHLLKDCKRHLSKCCETKIVEIEL